MEIRRCRGIENLVNKHLESWRCLWLGDLPEVLAVMWPNFHFNQIPNSKASLENFNMIYSQSFAKFDCY